MRRPLLPLALVAACAAAALSSCQPATLRIVFRPDAGDSYRYTVKIHSVTSTRIGDRAPEVTVDDVVLESDQTVLSTAPGDVRVRVDLREAGSPNRTFDVRLDRAAQLAGVETVEGLPFSVLGPGALPQILPGGLAAPPDRRLGPGDRWTVSLPTADPAAANGALQGSGRLVELRLLDGRKMAATAATTYLPSVSSETTRGGTMTLTGLLTTESTALRALADGAVESATSVTRGRQTGILSPPQGTEVSPLAVSQTIEVRSETVRR